MTRRPPHGPLQRPGRARAGAQWWRARSLVARDAVLALALAAAAALPGLGENGVRLGDLGLRPSGGPALLLAAVQVLPLLVRRRHPALCLALVAGGFAAYQLLGYPTTFAGVGLLVALYSAGAHLHRGRRCGAALALAGYVVLALLLERAGSAERPVDYVTFALVLAGAWAAGSWVRARALAEGERRRRGAHDAAAQERERIARELHDVVSHHVTAMVVQSEAAQYLVRDQPERASASLTAISSTGRRALEDLRHLLDALNGSDPDPDPDPEPARGAGPGRTSDLLRELVQRTRASGQPVLLAERGVPDLSADAELVVVRVVQEALTNAVKHAPGRPTGVEVRYAGAEVEVTVTTDGPHGVPAARPGGHVPAGGRRGLTGLRRRVDDAGGTLVAGPDPEGGFTVRATIPAGGAR